MLRRLAGPDKGVADVAAAKAFLERFLAVYDTAVSMSPGTGVYLLSSVWFPRGSTCRRLPEFLMSPIGNRAHSH
jgi:hypothetical protein